MADRKLLVGEADLRALLSLLPNVHTDYIDRLYEALETLGPEQCGFPSARGVGGLLTAEEAPMAPCVLPRDHHAHEPSIDPLYCRRCPWSMSYPIHCSDEHYPPTDLLLPPSKGYT